MKISLFILLTLLTLLLVSCRDLNEIRYDSNDVRLLNLGHEAAEFWRNRGTSIRYSSNNPNTDIFLVAQISIPGDLCRANWIDIPNVMPFSEFIEDFIEDNFSATIKCRKYILNMNYQDAVFVMAHEFGHVLKYDHSTECPNIMNPRVECMREVE